MIKRGLRAYLILTIVVAVLCVSASALVVDIHSGLSLTVTPGTTTPGAVTSYEFVGENTAGYTGNVSITGVIPEGYRMIPPESGGTRIVTARLYNGSAVIGRVIMDSNSSNPSGMVDIVATVYVDGQISIGGTKSVDYSPGSVNSVGPLTAGNFTIEGSLTLPTDTTKGAISANLSLPDGVTLTKVVIIIGNFVRNPPTEGEYVFSVVVNNAPANAPVPISKKVPPTAVPALTPIGTLVLVCILGIVIAFATKEEKNGEGK